MEGFDLIAFLGANWQYVLVVFYVAEKVVKMTPTKYDDIVLDMLVGGIYKLLGKKPPKGINGS